MARTVTDEHKNAIRRGRKMSSAVDAYLRAVTPKRRGRQVSIEELTRRRDEAAAQADIAEGVAKLKLIQQASDLQQRITETKADETAGIEPLEEAFIKIAAEYSEAQGITYATWREAGVSAKVLKTASITQTRRRR